MSTAYLGTRVGRCRVGDLESMERLVFAMLLHHVALDMGSSAEVLDILHRDSHTVSKRGSGINQHKRDR